MTPATVLALLLLAITAAVFFFLWRNAEDSLKEQKRLNDILLGPGDDSDYWDAVHEQEEE